MRAACEMWQMCKNGDSQLYCCPFVSSEMVHQLSVFVRLSSGCPYIAGMRRGCAGIVAMEEWRRCVVFNNRGWVLYSCIK